MPDASSSLSRRAVRLRMEQRLREGVRGSRAWMRGVGLGSRGSMPDFLIIGGMRCGTTSLYEYLARHPSVRPGLGKELQYFTVFHNRGERWYRGNFPAAVPGIQTFEASPYYLYHPLAPARVAELLPNGRFIALLRDPVERAYSHYKHSVERGVEPLSFADALKAEPERLAAYLDGGDIDSRKAHAALRSFSYFSRGLYAEQLERWYAHFAPEQLLVLRSEDMYADPASVYARCIDFLGLPPHVQSQFGVHSRPKPEIAGYSDQTRQDVRARFAPHNDQLQHMLGWEHTWPVESLR